MESLILFARPPRAGEVKTRLIPALGAEAGGDEGEGAERAAALYRAFLEDAAAAARAVRARRPGLALIAEWTLSPGESAEDLPLAEWLPGPFRHLRQEGENLGARMSAALERALGGDTVSSGVRAQAGGGGEERGGGAVLMGTDFPDLPIEIPLAAFRALEGEAGGDALSPPRAVLGPAADGGYFLIGLSRPAPALFENVPWGTSRVLDITLRRLREMSIEAVLLDAWEDVDDARGLAALRRRLDDAPPARAPRTRETLAALSGRLPPIQGGG